MKNKPEANKDALPVLITGSIQLDRNIPIIERITHDTPYGKVEGYRSESCLVILRHGWSNRTPPHLINHRANLWAAKSLGSFVFSTGSVGSLDLDAPPGSLALPDDIFSPFHVETISSDEDRIHVVPEFDSRLRRIIITELAFADIEFIDGGVYAQTRGPRFETRAEIGWLSDYAHFVGMTCASELTIASELQLPYALLVSIDNWGNGLGPKPLTMDEYLIGVERNHQSVCEAIGIILPALKRAAETGFGNAS